MINLEALNLCIDKQDWGPVAKQVAKRHFKKYLSKNQYNRLKPLFLYRYCISRFHLGDYSDYTGWEWRDEQGWAAGTLFNPQPLPRWDGGYVERLWVIGEQGIGDEIFYASLLPECLVRVKEVIYESDQRLHGVLRRSFPKLGLVDRPPEWAGPEAWNERSGVFIPAADLMRIFRRHRSHFPGKSYLKPDPDRISSLSRYVGRTGVAWRGRQGSMDPLRLGITDPLSLQYGLQNDEIESPDFDLMNDFESLFALCKVLKKVVTVPQSVHHVAGSVGTKVEIIVPDISGVDNKIPWDYSSRIQPDHKLPWYPDVKIFDSVNDWKINQVVTRMTHVSGVEGFTRV